MGDYSDPTRVKDFFDKTQGFDINNTSGGAYKPRPAVQQPYIAGVSTTPPPVVRSKSAATTNPFFVDPNAMSVNRKKNPFLVALAPALDAFGINIP